MLIAPPPTWDGRNVDEGQSTWAVMEGEDWVDVVESRPGIIPRLSGLGGSLTVRLGPFNAVAAAPPDGGPKRLDALILADRVVDGGVIRDVRFGEADDDAHACRIELTHPVEIDEDHGVCWWDRLGEVHHLKPSPWPIGEPAHHDWWSVAPRPTATTPRAVIVAYRSQRVGAWWASDWALGLEEVAAVGDPGLLADLIRWAKLPVLEQRSLPEVRRLVERWPVESLQSWLSDESPDGWRFVIRAAFRDWRPRPDQARRLARALGSFPIPEAATAFRLMGVYPVLMGRYLQAMAVDARREDMRVLYRMIREKVEADLRSEVCGYVGTDDTVHEGIERTTPLAPGFLKDLNKCGVAAVLDRPTEGEFDQRRNLDLAVTQHTACRLLLTLDILQSLEDERPSHWKGGRCGTL